jgi:cupin fold WbuC family metalloprotein
VLQGDVDYVTFDSRGNTEEVISMSDVNSAKPFYQSIRSEIFHTLLIRSDWLVFLEITEGPFNKGDTIFAQWSPEDINLKEVVHFVENLNQSIRN